MRGKPPNTLFCAVTTGKELSQGAAWAPSPASPLTSCVNLVPFHTRSAFPFLSYKTWVVIIQPVKCVARSSANVRHTGRGEELLSQYSHVGDNIISWRIQLVHTKCRVLWGTQMSSMVTLPARSSLWTSRDLAGQPPSLGRCCRGAEVMCVGSNPSSATAWQCDLGKVS